MGFWDDAEVISAYTLDQALEDGLWGDLTEWIQEGAPHGVLPGAGIPVGMAGAVLVSSALFEELSNVPDLSRCVGQDLRGRAHDVLFMAGLSFKRKFNSVAGLVARGGAAPATMRGQFGLYLDLNRNRRQRKWVLDWRWHLDTINEKTIPVLFIGFAEDMD